MGRVGEVSVPRGLTLRDTSEGVRIQVSFVWEGKQCRELLPPGKLTKSYIEYATGFRAEIKRRLADGTFNYASYFPNSPRAQESAPVVAPLTLGSLLIKQLQTYERQAANGSLSPSTLQGYSKAIKNRLIPKFGSMPLSELAPSMLREWVADLGVTAKTVRNALTPLRSVLDDAVNDELLEFNPLDRIALGKLLRQTTKKSEYQVDPFDQDECVALIKAARSDERAMVQFWLQTGLRPGELIALSWSSIDWIKGKVRIEANQVTGMQDGKIRQIDKTPKTESGKRDIDLSAAALDALSAQKAVSFLEGGRVWFNPRTAAPWLSDAQIRKTLWDPLCKRAGVRYRNPYQVRHTFASTLLTAGANPFWLVGQMGHVDVQMIFRTYGKFIPANFTKAGANFDHVVEMSGTK